MSDNDKTCTVGQKVNVSWVETDIQLKGTEYDGSYYGEAVFAGYAGYYDDEEPAAHVNIKENGIISGGTFPVSALSPAEAENTYTCDVSHSCRSLAKAV